MSLQTVDAATTVTQGGVSSRSVVTPSLGQTGKWNGLVLQAMLKFHCFSKLSGGGRGLTGRGRGKVEETNGVGGRKC